MAKTTETPSPLDELVCFALYSAEHATGQAYRALLAPWKLTYPQYLVLLLLWSEDGRRVSGLGAELGLDTGTLSPLLRRMEQAGLLVRSRGSEDDERVVLVSLTQRGRELESELSHIGSCIAEGSGLSAESARAIIKLLHGFTAGMQDTTAGAR